MFKKQAKLTIGGRSQNSDCPGGRLTEGTWRSLVGCGNSSTGVWIQGLHPPSCGHKTCALCVLCASVVETKGGYCREVFEKTLKKVEHEQKMMENRREKIRKLEGQARKSSI